MASAVILFSLIFLTSASLIQVAHCECMDEFFVELDSDHWTSDEVEQLLKNKGRDVMIGETSAGQILDYQSKSCSMIRLTYVYSEFSGSYSCKLGDEEHQNKGVHTLIKEYAHRGLERCTKLWFETLNRAVKRVSTLYGDLAESLAGGLPKSSWRPITDTLMDACRDVIYEITEFLPKSLPDPKSFSPGSDARTQSEFIRRWHRNLRACERTFPSLAP